LVIFLHKLLFLFRQVNISRNFIRFSAENHSDKVRDIFSGRFLYSSTLWTEYIIRIGCSCKFCT